MTLNYLQELIQTQAISSVRTLTAGVENQGMLVNEGALPLIVGLLRSPNVEIQARIPREPYTKRALYQKSPIPKEPCKS